MRIGNIHTDVRPDEFRLTVMGGMIMCAEWRTDIEATEEPQGFTARTQTVEKCVAATVGEAKRLLMLCKYPDPSAEVALMRRGDDDPEKAEHEAYHDRVATYVESVIGG